MDDLQQAALALTSGGRGILAADERESTMNARLQAAGIEPDPRRRREYREILITTPNLSSAVNAVILSAETLAQPSSDGRSFPALLTAAGMTPGVKADLGSRDVLPSGELITTGLDGLDRRLAAARRHGATFAKWRAAFSAGPDLPSSHAVGRNVEAMVRFAVAARNQGMVPLVEPEILPDRGQDIAICADVRRIVLSALFECLHGADVDMSHVALKTGMIMPGSRAAGAARSEMRNDGRCAPPRRAGQTVRCRPRVGRTGSRVGDGEPQVRIHPHGPPGRTCSATRSACPARWARVITGTSPARDTRFGSSNDACVLAALCNNRTYKVSSRTGCWKL